MGSLFEYISWRGDISLADVPTTPVDTLIFSLLSYVDFTGIVPQNTEQAVRLGDAIEQWLTAPHVEKTAFERNHTLLLRAVKDTVRFGDLPVTAARKIHDRTAGIQFGALAFLLPGQTVFIAFEGTDDSLVGWKEDLRMSYECPVPGHLKAAEYTFEIANAFPLRRLLLGGHSKGGNLALYAAVKGDRSYRHRIAALYNHDGPGFCDDTVNTPTYREMQPRIVTYLPASSIVAVLLEHDNNYKIVKSSNKGILQHDGYSWEVQGGNFVRSEERSPLGKKTEAVIARFLRETTPEHRRQFVETLFQLLEASEEDSVTGLGKQKSLRNILRAYTGLAPEVREMLSQTVSKLNQVRRTVTREQRDAIDEKTDA
ncbi:MAG: DUF2974 domain-containing protein [Ruminococcaceae bacterium]|nr:DUF2974 domain-containing protein [Oscillospiraceae bacterium]